MKQFNANHRQAAIPKPWSFAMRGSILALTLALAAAPAAAQTASTAAPAAAAAAPAVVLTETQWILLGRQVTEWLLGRTDRQHPRAFVA